MDHYQSGPKIKVGDLKRSDLNLVSAKVDFARESRTVGSKAADVILSVMSLTTESDEGFHGR